MVKHIPWIGVQKESRAQLEDATEGDLAGHGGDWGDTNCWSGRRGLRKHWTRKRVAEQSCDRHNQEQINEEELLQITHKKTHEQWKKSRQPLEKFQQNLQWLVMQIAKDVDLIGEIRVECVKNEYRSVLCDRITRHVLEHRKRSHQCGATLPEKKKF